MQRDSESLTLLDELITQESRRIDEIQKQVAPLLAEQARLEDRLRALKEARSTFPLSPGQVICDEGDSRLQGTEFTTQRIRRQVAEVLRDSPGRTMHINEIYSEFRRRGWKVPGAGKPNNITAHLSKAEEIKSPKRGMWRLVESS